ncbi:cell division site-positioning protein MapZ family protein [Streptococcus suis]|uniref:cell division site-positioning protein MapZ family protein n=1 Tax=Streptococcus suis TaxID=1307 RepID=UPI0024125A7C|nr:cell division site-positioning protein MapZ family protein [Streptococcus suis]MDG4519127.1 cell division site-positioning protein MapZ family protein [Streptococcus suis]
MDEKNNFKDSGLIEEEVLDFESAKDLTIGEAVKKQKEMESGITEEDSLLDRYIKQHRDEIESQKFETKVSPLPVLESIENEMAETDERLASEAISEPTIETNVTNVSDEKKVITLDETVVMGTLTHVNETDTNVSHLEFEDDDWGQAEEAKRDRKKIYFWSAAGLLFVSVVATALVWMNSANQLSSNTDASSTSTSQTTTSSSTDANVTAFEQLYASFFTDSSLTKLKNSEFGKLTELKALLDKLDKSSDSYKKAKEQYDALEKAITAIQATNAQFDKDVIVDGEIDTTATVKVGETLSATTTGISSVDALLASVVNFGRSQQEVASSTLETEASVVANNQGAETAVDTSTSGAAITAGEEVTTATSTSYGIPIPAGVTLQRDRSRVPYNQAMIDDANNEAWNFTPGTLENIVAISQQRGYITGNQYILEKVNIINGNGYYNMFKPDGTYLFSINCKTGYFVGNAAGNSDALDY